MPVSVSDKIGVKEEMRSLFVNAPSDVRKLITVPHLDLKTRLSGKFGYIHLFIKNQKQFHQKFPRTVAHLNEPGMLWVSWPKSGQLETDLNIKSVIKLGYDYGMVESKTISINSVWSAIKFTWPRKSVVYKNSYGKLKKSKVKGRK